jgi:hypothetical protein
MVERTADRAEERGPLGRQVGGTQPAAGLIEATIGPGVVAGETVKVTGVHLRDSAC